MLLYAVNVKIRMISYVGDDELNGLWSFIEKRGVSLAYVYPFAIAVVGIELYAGECITGTYWATWILDVILIIVIVNDVLALRERLY